MSDKLISAPNVEYLVEVADERGFVNLIFRDKAGLHIEFKLQPEIAAKLGKDLAMVGDVCAAVQPALKKRRA